MADNNQDSGAASNLAAKERHASPASSSGLDKLNASQKSGYGVLSVSEQLILGEEMLPLYSAGSEEFMSSDTWTKHAEDWVSELPYGTSPIVVVALLRKRLTGDAKAAVVRNDCNTPRALLDTLKTAFPKRPFQKRLVQRLETGEAVRGMTRQNAFRRLTDILREVSDVSIGTMEVADTAQRLFPSHWMHMRVNSCTASAEEVGEALKKLEHMVHIDKQATPQLYGKAKASSAPQSLTSNTPGMLTKNQRRRNKDKMRIQELEQQLRAATSGTTTSTNGTRSTRQ